MAVLRPGKLTMWVMDNKRELAKVIAHLPKTATLSGVADFAVALSDAVDAIIEGQIISAVISWPLGLHASVRTSPTAISDIEETAVFEFGDTNKKLITRVTLPTFKPSLVAADGKSLVVSGDINTFLNRMESGNLGTEPVSAYGTDIVWTLRKYHRFRESRS